MLKKTYNTILDEHLHTLIAQGSHEAYERLKKRYIYHSFKLCREFLIQYRNTGISASELVAVCNGCFLFVVTKYDASLSSFYSFWKQTTSFYVAQYLTENSYTGEASNFNGSISIDQELEDNRPMADLLCEIDEDKHRQKMIADIRLLIKRNSFRFTNKENMILNLVLDGYTLGELEHSGVISRSKLYLTFKSAIVKLQKIIDRARNNH